MPNIHSGSRAIGTACAHLLTKAMRVGDDVKDWKLVGGTAVQQTLLSVAACVVISHILTRHPVG